MPALAHVAGTASRLRTVELHEQPDDCVFQAAAVPPATLGDVLYAGKGKALVPETEWVALVRAIAAGEQPALHALYERAHRLVFTLAVRICSSRETAEEITLDVFHDVWRSASGYDPANGTVVGWIMNQARSRAIDRLRFEQRLKRVDPGIEDPLATNEAPDPREVLELKEQGRVVRAAMAVLTPSERQVVEAAFMAEMTHAEVAARLNEPLGTVKTRIRNALKKLREAMGTQERS
jgi:RNA polymerase sigma-70 factor, ECF subfamily